MRKSADIYGYDRILERTLDKLRGCDIDKESKDEILEFVNQGLLEGLSKPRLIKYASTLKQMAKLLKKPFLKARKEDILTLVRKIERKDYSDWTKRDYKIVLKKFFKWLRKSEDYPEEVKWIKARIKKNNILPEELLTEEEVKLMAEHANNLRDKAFILVLYESGCRIGEMLSVKIRNVAFDKYGAQLIVNGKTGSRRVRIIMSSPMLASWMNIHPLRNDPDSPLWISLGTNHRNFILSYRATCEMLKEAAKRSGIRKRVYPHLFRHSRATHLANHLTEAQLKQHFGWVQGSSMAATYVHLSGKEVDNTLLKLQGIEVEQDKNQPKLKVVLCTRCGEKNCPTSKFCVRCGSPLDFETALKLDEFRAKADKLISILIRDPEILDKLLNKIEELKTEPS